MPRAWTTMYMIPSMGILYINPNPTQTLQVWRDDSVLDHQSRIKSTDIIMHPALQLTEISEVVCQFLDRPSLAWLARTCRAFEEPALDALWKVIAGLEPLTRLLPDSMWVFEGQELVVR